MARASKLWNLSALQFYFQKYDNTLGQVTRLRLPYENPSEYFSDTGTLLYHYAYDLMSKLDGCES